MKKLILLGFIVALSIATFAQSKEREKRTPEERAARQTEKMTKELSLTPSQATKVKAILVHRNSQRDSIRAAKSGERRDFKAAKDKTDADLKAILTPDQYTKMQAMKKDHGHGHHGKGKGK